MPQSIISSLCVGDLSGQRRPAFVLGLSNGAIVCVEGGKVVAASKDALPSSPGLALSLACADLNADGVSEVIIAPAVTTVSPELVVLRLEDGHFKVVTTHPLDPRLFENGCNVAAGCFGPARSSRWVVVAPKNAENPTVLFYKLVGNSLTVAAAPLTPSFAAPGVVRGLSIAVGPVRGCRFFSELLVAPTNGLASSSACLEMFSLQHQRTPDNDPLLPIFTRTAPLLESEDAASALEPHGPLPSFSLVSHMATASLPPALFAGGGADGLNVTVCASTCTHGAVALVPTFGSASPASNTIHLFHGFGLPPPTPVTVEVIAAPFFASSLGVLGTGMLIPPPLDAAGKSKPIPGPARPSLIAFDAVSAVFSLLTPPNTWIPIELGAALVPGTLMVPGWRALTGKEAGAVGSTRLLGWEEGFYGKANPYRVVLPNQPGNTLVAAAIASNLAIAAPTTTSSFSAALDANSPLLTSFTNPAALTDNPDVNSWHAAAGFTSWGPRNSPAALAFPRATLKQMASQGADWLRQRIVAHALVLAEGLDYQHHHSPFFGCSPYANDAGRRFSTVFAGRHTQGLDCSNMTSFIMLCSLGLHLSSAISEQAEQLSGDLNPPTPSARGTNKAAGVPKLYAQRLPLPQPAVEGPPIPFDVLASTLKPGDLLYLQKGGKGAPRDKPIGHVILWIGSSLGRRLVKNSSGGSVDYEPCHLFIDSHGGGPPISDSNGLITPFGPALRELREGSWYHDRLSHVHRFVHDGNGDHSGMPLPVALWDGPKGASARFQKLWANAAGKGTRRTRRASQQQHQHPAGDDDDDGEDDDEGEDEQQPASGGAGAVPVPAPHHHQTHQQAMPMVAAPIFLPPQHHQQQYQQQQQQQSQPYYPPPPPDVVLQAAQHQQIPAPPAASTGCTCTIM
jgi:hypothetical protein